MKRKTQEVAVVEMDLTMYIQSIFMKILMKKRMYLLL
jgi:hypothetical protein